jgi:hypothetical protein
VDDLIAHGATLSRSDVPLTDAEIEALRLLIRELWVVDGQRSQSDVDAGTWRLIAGTTDVGRVTKRASKISLTAQVLTDIKVEHTDGKAENLSQVFNGADQPFRLTFSEASYAYAAGQLFRDNRLLGNRASLLEVLTPTLPTAATVEKVDPRQHQVTFYHCKGGHTDVGASCLHEVVSQATKTLGFLTASTAELERRASKWSGLWNQTSVPRLRRGATVAAFIAAFSQAVAAPQATRRVVLVTSSLSKSAVTQAFHALDGQGGVPEAVHVLWLLSGFVDQCRNIGAVPEIVCRP